MSQKLDNSPAVIGIDIGKNSFHVVGQNQRGDEFGFGNLSSRAAASAFLVDILKAGFQTPGKNRTHSSNGCRASLKLIHRGIWLQK
jgi:hypothetical protein